MALAEEPYVGLGHFTEDYADRFFGRETECSLIIGNLRAARLTLLYAESGVGKSSVLRAGVVARLHAFADRDQRARGRPRLVPVVFSSWSEAPVTGLVAEIEEAIRPYLAEGEAPELPSDDLEQALELAGEALDATLLVILDQFEEYFLYPEEVPEPQQVAAQIARCVNRVDLHANFLISIREDSYARLGDLFRGKITNVYANFLHLDFLDRDGAREAIEKPVERVDELLDDGVHYELEPGLVDAVLDQVGREQDEIGEDGRHDGEGPDDEIETTYLQLVMQRLWEEEAESGSHRLRLQTLEELGGAQAVIRGHLDRAMEDDGEGTGLSADQRLVAAAIFHFLVTSGGTKIALTANDLADLSGRPVEEIDPVLQHLASPRLHILRPVVSENGRGEPRYEIFHDALAGPIVEWRTRVEEEELDKRLRRERAEKEKAQEIAAKAERREARERRLKRWALVVLGIVLVIAVAVVLVAQGRVAAEREDAEQSVKAAERINELARAPSIFDPAAVAVAGVAAHELSPTPESRNVSLGELQLNPGVPRILAGHTRGVETLAYWPGSENLASGGSEGTVRLWDAHGHLLGRPLVSSGDEVESIAVSPPVANSRIVAAGFGSAHSPGGAIKFWQVDPSGNLIRSKWGPYFAQPPEIAFDPRAAGVLAVAVGDKVEIRDVANIFNQVRAGTQDVVGQVTDLAFSPDGRRLLVATTAGGQELRLSSGRFVSPSKARLLRRPSDAVAVAANGSYAFATEGGVVLRNAPNRKTLKLKLARRVTSLAFARRGAVLVSGSEDWNVVTWDVASGRPFGPPRASAHSVIRDVAVNSAGDEIAAATGESLIKVWPLEPSHPLAMTVAGFSPGEVALGTYPEVHDLAIGSGGQVAVALGLNGASIWQLGDLADAGGVTRPLARTRRLSLAVASHGNVLAVGTGNSFAIAEVGPRCRDAGREPCYWRVPGRSHSETEVTGMVMRTVGSQLLLASSGWWRGHGVINLWEVPKPLSSGHIRLLSSSPIDAEILSVAFSQRGSLVAAATSNGRARVWDVSDPREPQGVSVRYAPGAEAQPVGAIAFNPDGSMMATAGGDQQVAIWTISRHGSRPPNVIQTAGKLFQSQRIESLAFSPDGSVLAAGDGSGRTCLYQVDNRTAIGGSGCLVGHEGAKASLGGINALRFNKIRGAGTVLLTGGLRQPVVAWRSDLWNLDDSDRANQTIAEEVCRLAGRNLSGDEWEEAFGATSLAGSAGETCPP